MAGWIAHQRRDQHNIRPVLIRRLLEGFFPEPATTATVKDLATTRVAVRRVTAEDEEFRLNVLISARRFFFQYFVERVRQVMHPLQISRRSAILIALQQMIFIGDVERRQHRQPRRIHGLRLLRHGAHLAVHVLGQLENVFRVGSAQVVRLVENPHAHTVVIGVIRVEVCREAVAMVRPSPLAGSGSPTSLARCLLLGQSLDLR